LIILIGSGNRRLKKLPDLLSLWDETACFFDSSMERNFRFFPELILFSFSKTLFYQREDVK
jgi:hypothetical protein